jgi:RNA polymerase sigma-70 factor (ECF subfamily)
VQQSFSRQDDIKFVIEKYSDMLIRISFTYMKNFSDAEDIAQEVFLKLMEKEPEFQNEEHEKAWLIRAVINCSKNRLKSSWFRKTLPLLEDRYEFTPKETEVMEEVLKLPAKYKSVIYLFYYEGYSISEIAGMLKQKESTVGSQLHRARGLLKSRLEEDFCDE